MRKTIWLAWLGVIFLTLGQMGDLPMASAQETIPPSIFIQSPREGLALQGLEIIEGKIRGDGFQAGQIQFSYSQDEQTDRTWFYIADLTPAVEASSQTSFRIEWNTTRLTDGNYDLRIVAEYQGGAAIFEVIPNLRIRNYSPVESPTPPAAPLGTSETSLATLTSTPEPRVTPTPLPDNPAVVQTGELYRTLIVTGISVTGAFFIGMMYWYIKRRTD